MSRQPADLFEVVQRILLVSWIAGCGKGLECPKSATAGAAAPVTPPAAPSSAPGGETSFTTFDCVKMETAAPQGVTSACGPEARSAVGAAAAGIRSWNGGGPEGTNWNADGLTCDAKLRSGCDGATTVILKVGSRELGRAVFERREPAIECRFLLPRQFWEHELDASEDLPFRTGIFRVEAYQTCSEPPTMVRAADHFVAGFAWGE